MFSLNSACVWFCVRVMILETKYISLHTGMVSEDTHTMCQSEGKCAFEVVLPEALNTVSSKTLIDGEGRKVLHGR